MSLDQRDSGGDATDTFANADQAQQVVDNAPAEQVEGHKGILAEILGMLSNQGINVDQYAQQAGLPHADVNNLDSNQLVQLTLQVVRSHPEIVQEILQRFPQAQGLFGSILASAMGGGGGAGGQSAGGGGILGGILGRLGL